MSGSSSPARFAREPQAEVESPAHREERKPLGLDQKLENRLTMKDLERLKSSFMVEGEGYDNRLSLNRDQFCEALSLLLKKGSREEYGELFDKIDVTREGIVDWDKFASHMLLEFYERDDRVKSTQVPQWKDLKSLPSPHKEIIQRMTFLKNTSRYIAISKEGCVSMWGIDLKMQRMLRTGTDSCRARDLWVTHFIPLQNINKIALSFTSKEIAIYDLSSKLEFNCQYKIADLLYTPLCLDYWSNPDNANEAVLVWGDLGGFVNILFFNSANIALFERPPAPAGEKQEPCLNVHLHDIVIGKYKNAAYTSYEAHKENGKGEWVREVRYSHYLECFISCATTSPNAVVIGWMEKHSSVNQSVTLSKGGESSRKKGIQRKSEFQISQGVNSFDYHDGLNLIATAGANCHVCLWNPYVVSKPNGVLRGHMASVIQVQFVKNRGQLISFSKDKVLRIWDVQLQVCIQRLAGMFPKGPEVSSVLFFDEAKDRSGLDRNRLFITFNYQITVLDMKIEVKDRIMSHEKPIIAVLYNTVYNQLVSLCQAGTLVMWMPDTGQKVKQFSQIHGNSEVTCMSQDQSQSRLFTGSTDGTVKVWDFNGHCYHLLECAGGQPADVCQILSLKHSILVVGWTKCITVFRNSSLREFHVQPADWKGGQEHVEDILSVDFIGPSTLASGSYDGEIIIWNTNSEHASRHMMQRSRRGLRSRSKSFALSREPTQVSQTTSYEERMNTFSEKEISSLSKVTSSRRSRAMSKVSLDSNEEQNEFGWAVVKLIFLEARRGNSAGGGANLVSCGGNGWVRFWNSSHNSLLAEFLAHQQSGSIIMATDKMNQYLVTADMDGLIKVWDILEYATCHVDETIVELPPLKSQFQPHQDMINSLAVFERSDRYLIASASSDCSVALWDIYGNRIGIFGQEEHWRIEPYMPPLQLDENVDFEREREVTVKDLMMDSDEDSQWEPDEAAINNPETYRINTWEKTVLGKDYQELRVQKRERRQPSTIPDLPYLHWERTGAPPAGPYSALDTKELEAVQQLVKPDPDKYFAQRPGSPGLAPKLPALGDTIRAAFDEKALFPSYILDFERNMKNYHSMMLTGAQKPKNTRANPQNVSTPGGQVAAPAPRVAPSPRKGVKAVVAVKMKAILGHTSRSSVSTHGDSSM
ncbi:WD repeat-containing protein 49-like isoform X2 [Pomacea canaliculata]|uniref:WD repeat-containing protein 49-like isoform X2 n=1 Tax=Pomacea canaliculata TaxID=400727 RepID=UPI000D727C56|nr:WD repeat-containing protein 49-like isoform X2 [Pomacea canaliculata]